MESVVEQMKKAQKCNGHRPQLQMRMRRNASIFSFT
jgi:hypothetical protein